MVGISDQEFAQFQRFIYEAAGIALAPGKKALVAGRLAKRLQHFQAPSYAAYFRLLASGEAESEVQNAIDLLTTNETYFFREPKHFDLLRQLATDRGRAGQAFRVWSAASSSGEEAYSIAMVLADCLGGRPFEVIGSDISTRVLARAKLGHYPIARTTRIPDEYLKRFCLRGVGAQSGTLLVGRELRSKVQFRAVNLNARLPAELGVFDVVFLRNVMIYFDQQTKSEVIERIAGRMKPGGHLLIGHSETLHGVSDAVQLIEPAVYLRPFAEAAADGA